MGLYTLLLNDKFVGGYLFEPAYDTFRALRTNLFINDFTEKFIAVNSVVSDQEREVSFLKDGVFSGTNRIGIGDSSYTINAIVIDKYLKSAIGSIPVVNFIKIDTEGHELGVLKGAEETINKNPGILLLIENSYTDQILDFFKDKNFKIFVIDKQGNISFDRTKFDKAYNLIAVGKEHPLYSTL
jgi:FkbM family methyltransferase